MAGFYKSLLGFGDQPQQQVPTAPTPIDYNAVMDSAANASIKAYKGQLNSQIDAYPSLERLSLGTVSNIASGLSGSGGDLIRYTRKQVTTGTGKNKKTTWEMVPEVYGKSLGNPYTRQATDVVQQTLNQGTAALADTGNRINSLGDLSGAIARDAQGRALGGATSIEQNLYDNAASDLALGRSLNAEEARNASQAARGAYAARGLGVGSGAAAAEILNRSAVADARYQQRLANAQAANQTREQGIQGRQTAALGMLGNTANIYGQGGGAYQNAAQLGFGGANALVNLDPYQRALGQGIQLGSGIQGQSGQMIGNTYNQALGMAGNVASFNTNMQASQYNSALNNNAATNAANQAAWGSVLGSAIGAGGKIGAASFCWVAREVYGESNPAWLEFRDWLLTRGSFRRVSRYAANGPRIAEYIATRPGWKARLRKWMDARRAELVK
jgi:hypothetical protein